MAVKFGASFGAEVTMLSTSPDKEKDARRLGAQKFALTNDPAAGQEARVDHFDFIIDTVSAKHDYNQYLSMLDTDGVMMCVGAPPTPAELEVFTLMGIDAAWWDPASAAFPRRRRCWTTAPRQALRPTSS